MILNLPSIRRRLSRSWHCWTRRREPGDRIGVPVHDSSIPRGWVDAARKVLKNNRMLARAGHRDWELSRKYCAARSATWP